MIEGKPSQTALMVAVMRAHHDLTAQEPKILNDDMAMSLTGMSREQVMGAYEAQTAQFAALSDRPTAELFVERISQSVCMRSRLVEGQFENGLEKGLQQLVILGAGLDSTAYRFADKAKHIQMFEVDYPSTQFWKKERLAALHIPIPENLSFVTYDFENQTLMEALLAGGVSTNKVTLFPWLGVQPYLTHETVKSTLKTLAGFAPGSEIVMDFVAPDYASGDDINADGLDQLNQIVSTMGEPFKSRYTPDELRALMLDTGFSQATIHNTGSIISRFFPNNPEVWSMPEHVETLASAKV